RRGLGIPILAVFGVMLSLVDKRPTIRQLYQIAELGKAEGEPTRAPTFMRLTVAPAQPRVEGAGRDFPDEIMAQIYDRGDGRPKRVPSPSTGRSFHPMAIWSSISVIRRGVTTKTIPKPPRASTDERCADIAIWSLRREESS